MVCQYLVRSFDGDSGHIFQQLLQELMIFPEPAERTFGDGTFGSEREPCDF
jgi:hypothetical protein